MNYTPVQAIPDDESELDAALAEVDARASAKPKPCKPCAPWCGCKYNGYPRVSCDPCCYINPYTGQQICLS